MDRVKLRLLEFHVVDGCNLNCVQCSHYSNFAKGGVKSPRDLHEELAPWSQKLRPRRMCLLGGEPTLNPDLPELLRITRRLFPASELMLVTNGFFLHRHPSLPEALRDCQVNLQVSKHFRGEEYTDKFRDVLRWLEDNRVSANVRQSMDRWMRHYRVVEGKPKPYNSNPKQAWMVCRQKTCRQIYQGHLWKCPAIAYFSTLENQFSLQDDPSWEPFRKYQSLRPTATIQQVQQFLSRRAEPACRLCPSKIKTVKMRDPLKKQSLV